MWIPCQLPQRHGQTLSAALESIALRVFFSLFCFHVLNIRTGYLPVSYDAISVNLSLNQVKCCKSTCKVTDIRDLLVCHYCFNKAFDKFYDMYTATWYANYIQTRNCKVPQVTPFDLICIYVLFNAGKEPDFLSSGVLFAVKITFLGKITGHLLLLLLFIPIILAYVLEIVQAPDELFECRCGRQCIYYQ